MGLFSVRCAKTELPLMHANSGLPSLETAILLHPDHGEIGRGTYDGYGRFGILEASVEGMPAVYDCGPGATDDAAPYGVVPALGFRDDPEAHLKLVLEAFYADEAYADLPFNRRDPGQGHFHDRADLLRQIHQQDPYAAYDWRSTFWTPFDQYAHRKGEVFTFERMVTQEDGELDRDVDPLYRIRFENGDVIDAWPEEVKAVPVNQD